MSLPTDPAENLATLIRCPSVTPAEGGALAALEAMLAPLGFSVERPVFSEAGTPDIENLYARRSGNGPHLMFAGHTDVVPVGDEAAWTHPPFSADIRNGEMYRPRRRRHEGRHRLLRRGCRPPHREPGRAARLDLAADHRRRGRPGDQRHGQAARLGGGARARRWDAAIVGEPTNPDALGDMIKIGRRGSISGIVTVHGRQGHAAYPHLADNPVRGMMTLVDALLDPAFDAGSDDFQPTNLEVTSIDVGNPATNVIPAQGDARRSTSASTTPGRPRRCRRRSTTGWSRQPRARSAAAARPSRSTIELSWRDRPSHVFLTRDEKLIAALAASVEAVTGRTPALSTSGGTSDARFIKDYCPVVEFGLVGKTMHMVDERVPLADLETLTQIYERFLEDWFG